MKTRNWLAVAFSALALGTFSILGNAYMAPHAHAQPLAQARPVTSVAGLQQTFTICLWDATSECLRSHGGGNQVTIESSNYAVFHIVNANVNSQWQMEDAGGKCLRAYADGSVGLAFGGCDTTNRAEWWAPNTTNPRVTYENVKYFGFYMGTYGTSSGLGVWIDQPHTGFYWGWLNGPP